MSEQLLLSSYLDSAAALIEARVGRLHQALGELVRLSSLLLAEAPVAPAAIDAWLREAGFGTDEDGYFTQLPLLRAARDRGQAPEEISYFWPQARIADPETRRRMHALRGLTPLLRSLHRQLGGDVQYIYYQDDSNAVVTYPFIDARTAIPPDFDWHGYYTYRSAGPAANPERRARWAFPGDDLGSQGPFGILSIPVWLGDRFLGLWNLDVPWRGLYRHCVPRLDWLAGQALIAERSGRILEHGTLGPRADTAQKRIEWQTLAALGGALGDLLPDGLPGPAGKCRAVDGNGVEQICLWRDIPELDWVLLALVPSHRLPSQAGAEVRAGLDHLRTGDLGYRIPTPERVPPDELVAAYNRLAADLEEQCRGRAESEQRYRQLFTEMRDLFFLIEMLWDDRGQPVDFRLVDLNLACEEFLGMTRAEALGRTLRDLGAPPDPGLLQHYGRVARAGGQERFDYHAATNGRDYRIHAFTPGQGLVAVIASDVTESRRVEQALRATDERVRASLAGTGVGLWDWDLVRNAVTFVRHWAEILGYPPEAIYGTGGDMWLDHIHPDDKGWVVRAWEEHLAGLSPQYEAVHRLRAYDGSWRWILDKGQVIARAPDGRPLRAVGVHMDVTEQETARHALRSSSERLAVLHEVDRAVLAATSPRQTAEAVLARVGRLIPCDRAAVTLFDAARRSFAVLALREGGRRRVARQDDLSLDPEAPAMARLRRDEVVLVGSAADAAALPFPPSIRERLRLRGLRAFMIVPLLARRRLIGSLNLGARAVAAFSPEHVQIARELASSLAVAIQGAELAESIRAQQAQLRALGVRLAKAEEAERHRLARELHDQVGQNLTALGLNLHMVQELLGGSCKARVAARLDDSLKRVKDTMDSIRTVMTDLRPTVLDDYGLPAALRWYAGQVAERAQLAVRVVAAATFPRLDPVVETALFRIAQEALTNVTRHAGARTVSVTLDMRPAGPRLRIDDDGAGFDPRKVRRPAGSGAGLGLLSMRERATAAGAQLVVSSRPGRGTRVTVQVKTAPGA